MQKILYIIFIILLVTKTQEASPQQWGGEKNIGIWKLISINANVGTLSYFGDMSKYDSEPFGKLKSESGPAYGFVVTKFFYNKFGISGQMIHGNIRGSGKDQSFTTQIVELNLHVRTELLNLVFPHKQYKFGISPYVGIGQFYFKASTTYTNEETTTVITQRTGVPEFVYFIGTGLSYKIPSNLALTADFSIRQSQNDKLDNYVANNDFDYYSYINIGITYRIHTDHLQPMKNKTRLARTEPYHSSRKHNKACRKG